MERSKINIWWGPPKKFTARIEERKISWLELFYDLVYVIAISKVTHHFAAHPNLSGLTGYSFLFIMIFWGWLNGSMYHDLHGSPGIRTRFMTLWQMMAVAALVVCLSSPSEVMVFRSTIALVVLELFITYLWLSVGFYDKAHRVYSRRYILCFSIAAALLIGSLYADHPYNLVLTWMALVLNFVPPFLVIPVLRHKDEDFSLSSNMVERLGLFTIIVFGECVLGVINSVTDLPEMNFSIWLSFGMGILIVFALWWIYFSVIADTESKKGFLVANLIQLAYIPTLASLGIAGASFPGLFRAFSNDADGHAAHLKYFFGAALGLFLAGIVILSFLLHYPQEFHFVKRKVRKFLIATIVLIAAITFFSDQISLLTYLTLVFLLLLFNVILVTRIWFVVQLKMMGEKNERT